jgi:hypothetical protein
MEGGVWGAQVGCFSNNWAMNSRTRINKWIKYLLRDPWDSISQTFTTTPFLVWFRVPPPLFCFVSLLCSLASCASNNFLQSKALAPPMLVLCKCPRCQMIDAFPRCIMGHYMLIKLKNLLLIKFRC